MKKTAILLCAIVLMVSMMSGCRKTPSGNPGDPTVNNSSTPEPMTTAGTVAPTQTVRPTTEPSTNTQNTEMNTTEGSGSSEMNSNPSESGNNGTSRNKNRIMPGR